MTDHDMRVPRELSVTTSERKLARRQVQARRSTWGLPHAVTGAR